MTSTSDRAKSAFGNPQDERVWRKAVRGKEKFLKKFGDDSNATYHLASADVPVIGAALGVRNLVMAADDKPLDLVADATAAPLPAATPRTVEGADGAPVIVGNIRMGFGHYRISMAMASAAHAMGYTPYWLDLASFDQTTGSKVIAYQNDLYSLGSRLSQKVGLFNRLYWEPLNSEGFRKLSYNAGDQKNAELCVPLFADIPTDTPYVGTHVWPAQAAVHAGMTHVVNAIPDNWPMALHLAEGAIHTVQTPSSYLGYHQLRGMDPKRQLRPMPLDAITSTTSSWPTSPPTARAGASASWAAVPSATSSAWEVPVPSRSSSPPSSPGCSPTSAPSRRRCSSTWATTAACGRASPRTSRD